jgi:serine/threonine-protein kinase
VLVGVLVVLLLVAGGLLIPGLLGSGSVKQVDVPSVVGQTVPQATTTLQQADLVLGTHDPVFSTTVPVGHIVSQRPKSLERAPAGSAVNVTVSAGEQTHVVPDMTPYSFQTATTKLEALGFRVHGIKVADSTLRLGRVIRTDPAAGTTQRVGTTINVYYSGGYVQVPNVVGKSESVATAELKQAHFRPISSSEVSNEPAGTVIKQDPAPLSRQPYGSTVIIYVSLGPTTTPTSPTTPTGPTTPTNSTTPTSPTSPTNNTTSTEATSTTSQSFRIG